MSLIIVIPLIPHRLRRSRVESLSIIVCAIASQCRRTNEKEKSQKRLRKKKLPVTIHTSRQHHRHAFIQHSAHNKTIIAYLCCLRMTWISLCAVCFGKASILFFALCMVPIHWQWCHRIPLPPLLSVSIDLNKKRNAEYKKNSSFRCALCYRRNWAPKRTHNEIVSRIRRFHSFSLCVCVFWSSFVQHQFMP